MSMKTKHHLFSLLTMLSGCAADFSPDPYDRSNQGGDAADSGARRDGGRPQADSSTAGNDPDGERNNQGTDSATGRDGGRPQAGSSTAGNDASQPDPGGEQSSDAGDEQPPPDVTDDPLAETTVGCNLGGRWLMTERTMVNAFGTQQIVVNLFYVELKQEGDNLSFARSVVCGDTITGLFPIIITVDDSPAWPSYLTQPSYEERKGTSAASGNSCSVSFDKSVLVRGATVEAYRDLDVPLPTADQQASGSTPGWEDWDADGHPGISLYISGSISGTLYAATRTWTQASGMIASGANKITLPLVWGQTRSTLGIDGSPLLSSDGGPDPDPAQHFVQLARLSADQAAGDDATLCARMRMLAPTLTPTPTE